MAAYVVENDKRAVDAANGVVAYPWLDGHHAGVEAGHVGGIDERSGGGVSLKVGCSAGASRRWSSLVWVTKLEVVGG